MNVELTGKELLMICSALKELKEQNDHSDFDDLIDKIEEELGIGETISINGWEFYTQVQDDGELAMVAEPHDGNSQFVFLNKPIPTKKEKDHE